MVSRLKQLKSLKDADIEYYGCLEEHQDGTPHYHALLSLSKQACWEYKSTRRYFQWPENYNQSLNIVFPEERQSTYHFVRNHVNYMQKQAPKSNFIGKALSAIKEARKETRIEYDFILSGANRQEVEACLRKLHPEVLLDNTFITNIQRNRNFLGIKYPSYIDPFRLHWIFVMKVLSDIAIVL